ncbi:glycosyltransferase family 2 protein [Streptomyces sp. YGL11-2]|uniref:glycosyltransferase family 2 protein n=1 Tax=Streptomyces sp. YGL11-2 TaxID=3414028 RepID=UPI003CF3CD81
MIIPTTLQRPAVRATVESALSSLAYLPSWEGPEVLVVVNGAQAGDELASLGSPMLRVVRTPRRSAPGARNLGIALARNNTLLFADDDCLVPVSWCHDLGTALADGACTAVAAPVRMAVLGSVSAFLDYQRPLDARPGEPGWAASLVTANCGVRRDLLPDCLRFDDVNFNNAAEDKEFALRLQAAGGTVRWLEGVTPVIHRLSEDIEEISERFLRYGHARVRLHTRKKHPGALHPDVQHWYRVMADNEDPGYRQFSEFTDPAIRSAFACYDLILNACYLIGYLEGLDAECHSRLIQVNHAELQAGWRLAAQQHTVSITSPPAPDYTRLGRLPAAHNGPLTWLSDLLRQHAPLTSPQNARPATVRYRSIPAPGDWRARLFKTWRCLTHPPGSATEMAALLRSQGASFREGCHELEVMLSHS